MYVCHFVHPVRERKSVCVILDCAKNIFIKLKTVEGARGTERSEKQQNFRWCVVSRAGVLLVLLLSGSTQILCNMIKLDKIAKMENGFFFL